MARALALATRGRYAKLLGSLGLEGMLAEAVRRPPPPAPAPPATAATTHTACMRPLGHARCLCVRRYHPLPQFLWPSVPSNNSHRSSASPPARPSSARRDGPLPDRGHGGARGQRAAEHARPLRPHPAYHARRRGTVKGVDAEWGRGFFASFGDKISCIRLVFSSVSTSSATGVTSSIGGAPLSRAAPRHRDQHSGRRK